MTKSHADNIKIHMKGLFTACIIGLIILFTCHKSGIKYGIYANGQLAFEILPSDIAFYDTSQYRGYTEIHEIRLKDRFYQQDSIALAYPIEIICLIDGKQYFLGEHFCRAQSEPSLAVNFHFDPACDNSWKFTEGGPGKPREGDSIVLYTNNACNSIELFHKRKEIYHHRESYYDKQNYFLNYIDTARLAHKALLDPYYLNAIEKSGIPVK